MPPVVPGRNDGHRGGRAGTVGRGPSREDGPLPGCRPADAPGAPNTCAGGVRAAGAGRSLRRLLQVAVALSLRAWHFPTTLSGPAAGRRGSRSATGGYGTGRGSSRACACCRTCPLGPGDGPARWRRWRGPDAAGWRGEQGAAGDGVARHPGQCPATPRAHGAGSPARALPGGRSTADRRACGPGRGCPRRTGWRSGGVARPDRARPGSGRSCGHASGLRGGARAFGVSPERVRQIEPKAPRKVREAGASAGGPDGA